MTSLVSIAACTCCLRVVMRGKLKPSRIEKAPGIRITVDAGASGGAWLNRAVLRGSLNFTAPGGVSILPLRAPGEVKLRAGPGAPER